MLPDCGAVERAVRHKAVDESLDIAAVERRRVAHEQIADREPVFDFGEGHGFVWRLFDRNKDGVPDLAFYVIGEVALTGRVLDKDYVAGRDEPAFAVARGDLHPGVEIDDVLPPRRRVPIDIVLGLGLAKDDTRHRQFSRQFAAPPFLDPFDLDIPEMRLALGVGVEIVDAHLFLPEGPNHSAARAVAGSSANAGMTSRAKRRRLARPRSPPPEPPPLTST